MFGCVCESIQVSITVHMCERERERESENEGERVRVRVERINFLSFSFSGIADLIKLYFFADEEFFRFFACKLVCLIHIEIIDRS